MRILAIISGKYGQRHVDNIRANGPSEWSIEVWQAPPSLPIVMDYPEDFVPDDLPHADLVLSFGELPGIAELVPEVVEKIGAKAVIAPVDSEAWLPRGLARQLRGWLADMGVVCVTPKPLCTLTPTYYEIGRRKRIEYEDPLIAEFARHFGRPQFEIEVDPQKRIITSVKVVRDAFCGCARHVAEGLIGISADDAEQKAGLLHHHYPCLASMGIDSDYDDTLMHISGNIMKDAVGEQVRPHKQIRYFMPGTRSE